MTLEPIDERNVAAALAVLTRGFPARDARFWAEGLERLSAHRRATGGPPIGRLLMAGGQAVGVVLTIASKSLDGARDVVNLSSWYVDEKYRWLAPRMLAQVVADDTAVYTDFTPSPHAAKINEKLGFRTVATGAYLHFLPWEAIGWRSSGRVVPIEQLPEGALTTAELQVMERHRELGCVAAALWTGTRYEPLLFKPVRRKGLPVGRVLLAPAPATIAEHMRPISHFLLRHGMLFLSMQGDSAGRSAGGLLWDRMASTQIKGQWEPGRIDQTYSELVFFRL